ncbi:MAG: YheU family protein [Polyangiales bacterium]
MPTHVEVPYTSLSHEALEGLVEEFVTREGTDYGPREHSLDEKRADVLRQLARREVAIVFDLTVESTTLVRREELARLVAAASAEDEDA